MALRKILTDAEAALHKTCKPVTAFDSKLHTLLDDMRDTMMEANGVGLAAPQVGILRRVVVVLDTNREELEEEDQIIELVNPAIIEVAGEQTGAEGCLSVPGVYGIVTRPEYVKVRAQDRFGKVFEVEGTGLTARAFCHEIDHLDGVVFVDKVIEYLEDDE